MSDAPEKEVLALHRRRFGEPVAMFAAPGRVNLIGEHTDYSEGFVMPAAIDFSTVVAISPRPDSDGHARVAMFSANFDSLVEHSLDELTSGRRDSWTDYPAAVLWSLQQEGLQFPGFNLTIAGDVPVGAGLSSSASIEVAVAAALLAMTDQHLDLKEIAQICQRAENEFVGANCGIMDQIVVGCGKPDRALMLDCRTLDFRLVAIPSGVQIILCNSMVKHSVAAGEYNTRRAEIESGVAILAQHHPSLKFLRDVTMQELNTHRSEMPDNVFRRCRHVITENQRVLDAASAFERGDLARFGQLMRESHDSYRDDFEASCKECDILVELAQKQLGCYGARLTGGGFGGCTVNLVADQHSAAFIRAMSDAYKQATSIAAEIYQSKASAGVHRIEF